MGDPRRRLLGKQVTKLPMRRLVEDDISLSFGSPVVEPCPNCDNTLADGFTPLTDSGYTHTLSTGEPWFTDNLTATQWEITASVSLFETLNSAFFHSGSDPFTPVHFTGVFPQLKPCKHRARLTFDYFLELLGSPNPASEHVRFNVNLAVVFPPNGSGGAAATTGTITQLGNGSQSGTLTLNFDGDIGCESFLVLQIVGDFKMDVNIGPDGSASDRTAVFRVNNFVVTDLGA